MLWTREVSEILKNAKKKNTISVQLPTFGGIILCAYQCNILLTKKVLLQKKNILVIIVK